MDYESRIAKNDSVAKQSAQVKMEVAAKSRRAPSGGFSGGRLDVAELISRAVTNSVLRRRLELPRSQHGRFGLSCGGTYCGSSHH